MKRNVYKFRALQLVACFLMLWGCDMTSEDVIPISFQEFKIYPDDIYIINSNSDWITRLDPLSNDSVKVEVNVSYSQPIHGELFPEFDGPGTMGYRPDTDFIGTDSLLYTVCAGESCQTEKIRLIVQIPNDPNNCETKLIGETLETTKNTSKQLRIFLNDTVCYNDSYGGTTIYSPEKGTFETIEYSGSYKNTIYVYYPPKDYVGTDSFRYRVYTSRDRSTYQEAIVQVTIR